MDITREIMTISSQAWVLKGAFDVFWFVIVYTPLYGLLSSYNDFE